MRKILLIVSVTFVFISCSQEKETWVFLMAGQSNMAGRGILESKDTISDPAIFMLNKELEVVVAKEPLHFYEPALAGLDCGLSFAKELKSQIPSNIEIILVPCAVGGSSIDQWLEDSMHRNVKLYTNFKQRMEVAKSFGTIKGVLWHQGESNAHPNKIPFYKNQLEQLIEKFRADIGDNKLPILIGELGDYAEPKSRNTNWRSLNNVIHTVAQNYSQVFVVNSAGLKSNTDMIHFNAEAQRELGKRFAEQYISINTNY